MTEISLRQYIVALSQLSNADPSLLASAPSLGRVRWRLNKG